MISKKRSLEQIEAHLTKFIKIKNKIKSKVSVESFALEINMTHGAWKLRKHRGTIPYENILDYCYANDINPISVFYIK